MDSASGDDSDTDDEEEGSGSEPPVLRVYHTSFHVKLVQFDICWAFLPAYNSLFLPYNESNSSARCFMKDVLTEYVQWHKIPIYVLLGQIVVMSRSVSCSWVFGQLSAEVWIPLQYHAIWTVCKLKEFRCIVELCGRLRSLLSRRYEPKPLEKSMAPPPSYWQVVGENFCPRVFQYHRNKEIC